MLVSTLCALRGSRQSCVRVIHRHPARAFSSCIFDVASRLSLLSSSSASPSRSTTTVQTCTRSRRLPSSASASHCRESGRLTDSVLNAHCGSKLEVGYSQVNRHVKVTVAHRTRAFSSCTLDVHAPVVFCSLPTSVLILFCHTIPVLNYHTSAYEKPTNKHRSALLHNGGDWPSCQITCPHSL